MYNCSSRLGARAVLARRATQSAHRDHQRKPVRAGDEFQSFVAETTPVELHGSALVILRALLAVCGFRAADGSSTYEPICAAAVEHLLGTAAMRTGHNALRVLYTHTRGALVKYTHTRGAKIHPTKNIDPKSAIIHPYRASETDMYMTRVLPGSGPRGPVLPVVRPVVRPVVGSSR